MRRFILLGMAVAGLATVGTAAPDTVSTKVLGGRVEILLPENMAPMPAEMRDLKFPELDAHMSEVYGDDDGSCAFVFIYEQERRRIDEGVLLQEFREYLTAREGTTVLDGGLEKIDYRQYFYVVFQSQAVNAVMHNIVKGTMVGEKQLLCSFSCPVEMKGEWAPLARESLDGLRILRR